MKLKLTVRAEVLLVTEKRELEAKDYIIQPVRNYSNGIYSPSWDFILAQTCI